MYNPSPEDLTWGPGDTIPTIHDRHAGNRIA